MIVSVILPIRNELLYIKRTINSIIDQTFDGEIEIIVADGMSQDGTREKVKLLQKIHKNIYLIDNPQKIVSTGFNKALNVAKGDMILRVDGHSKLKPNYIKNSLAIISKMNADCVGGPIKHVANGVIGESIIIAQSSKYGNGGARFRMKLKKGEYVDTLAFGCYKREVFRDIGGYDEELKKNQDDEFNFRLIQNGGSIWLDPTIKSIYYSRNSLFKFFNQYFKYGLYKIRVIQKRKGIASFRQLVPPTFVLTIFSGVISHIFFNNTILLNLVVISYILFCLFSAWISFIKINKPAIFPILLLPLTLLTMHFSYGFGFLFGSFKFVCKWNDSELKNKHFQKETFE